MKPIDSSPYTLLIEDDPWLAKSYQTVIEKLTRIKLASSSLEAIHLIDEGLPRLIIADVMLDDGLVIDLLHELQSYADTAPIPIILCTSLAGEMDLEQLKSYGVVKLFDKSTLTLDRLRAAIMEYR